MDVAKGKSGDFRLSQALAYSVVQKGFGGDFILRDLMEKALSGTCLFYHCSKYHSSYDPIRIVPSEATDERGQPKFFDVSNSVTSYCHIPTRRTRLGKRLSERMLSSRGSTTNMTMQSDRSSTALSNQRNAWSPFPKRT